MTRPSGTDGWDEGARGGGREGERGGGGGRSERLDYLENALHI